MATSDNYPRTHRFILALFILTSASLSSTLVAQSTLTWHTFEDALTVADSTNKPILVDVWAPWCGWCHKMKRDVYPELSKELSKNFILTRINRENNETDYFYKERLVTPLMLAKLLHIDTVPGIVFLNSKGDYLTNVSGYIQAQNLKPILKYISTETYKMSSYQDFLNK